MDPRAKKYYALAAALAVATAALLVLASGALGIIGSGEADEVYLAALAMAVLGSVVARLRARGMVVAMAATAVVVVLAPVVAFVGGMSGTAGASVRDVAGVTALFAGLFVVSSLLFRRASPLPRP